MSESSEYGAPSTDLTGDDEISGLSEFSKQTVNEYIEAG